MKIGYVGGHWHTNIGNAFYNLGALYFLQKSFPNREVVFIPDPPQELWLNVKNDYKIIPNMDCDIFVFCGPSFNKLLPLVYGETFEILKQKSKRIGFLSVGAGDYTKSEAEVVSKFLSNYSIDFISTRDSETYNLYKNLVKCDFHDGICTSMFLNDSEIVPQIDDNFVVFNFDYFSEPLINFLNGKYIAKNRNFHSFQRNLNGTSIVRTSSSPAKRHPILIYNRPNIYWSDLPGGYLSIYKSADMVFSDRVHSCCATLSLGGTAMYFKRSSRSSDGRNNLFNRLGVSEIFNKPQKLDFDFIEDEKKSMIDFIKKLDN